MKICFIAPANNYHTQKWCHWFRNRGHQVDAISFTEGEIEGCTVHYINSGAGVRGSDAQKLKYLFQARKVHEIVNEIKPDVINAHYATSYGPLPHWPVFRLTICPCGGRMYTIFPRRVSFTG